VPRCGFSLAVSGMMIPPAVFSSAGAGFTITLSCSGVMFTLFDIISRFLKVIKTFDFTKSYHILCHSFFLVILGIFCQFMSA
jgi:hypothetical protein